MLAQLKDRISSSIATSIASECVLKTKRGGENLICFDLLC